MSTLKTSILFSLIAFPLVYVGVNADSVGESIRDWVDHVRYDGAIATRYDDLRHEAFERRDAREARRIEEGPLTTGDVFRAVESVVPIGAMTRDAWHSFLRSAPGTQTALTRELRNERVLSFLLYGGATKEDFERHGEMLADGTFGEYGSDEWKRNSYDHWFSITTDRWHRSVGESDPGPAMDADG